MIVIVALSLSSNSIHHEHPYSIITNDSAEKYLNYVKYFPCYLHTAKKTTFTLQEYCCFPILFSLGGVDFNTAYQTVTFPSGITTRNVSISVFNDTIVEGDEMFDLTLTVPELFNGRISAGSRDMAVGIISDNSSEFVFCAVSDNNYDWFR